MATGVGRRNLNDTVGEPGPKNRG